MNTLTIRNSSLYLAIHGFTSILIGLAFILIDTSDMLNTIVQIFGIVTLLIGIVVVWRSLLINKNTAPNLKTLMLMQGILLLVIGLFTIFYHDFMIKFVMLFIGIWVIISGGYQTYYGYKASGYIKSNKVLIVNGIFLLIIGFIIAFRHELFLDILGKIIGWVSLLTGIVTLFYALMIYQKRNDFEDAEILDE